MLARKADVFVDRQGAGGSYGHAMNRHSDDELGDVDETRRSGVLDQSSQW